MVTLILVVLFAGRGIYCIKCQKPFLKFSSQVVKNMYFAAVTVQVAFIGLAIFSIYGGYCDNVIAKAEAAKANKEQVEEQVEEWYCEKAEEYGVSVDELRETFAEYSKFSNEIQSYNNILEDTDGRGELGKERSKFILNFGLW